MENASKIKVLYIGHYKENSGWGQAARDYILAMDSVGIDVVPQAVQLTNSNLELPTRLLELEQKNPEDCNICIQHVLPHYMMYNSHFKKNIGLFVLETEEISHTYWIRHLNVMDELWVPCKQMLEIKGVTKPTKLVPHTFDTTVYNKEYEKINLPVQNKFSFYFIGEFNLRKHIAAIIKAFHIEFKPEEPVELVLKINKPGVNPEVLGKEVGEFCKKIKENLRLYDDIDKYKKEIVISVHIPREDLLRLHSTCDCFVNPSYGDAWNIPCFEAMAMGNLVISSSTGGMKDYIKHNHNGLLVKGSMEPVFGQFDTIPGFGTAREKWFNISISNLMYNMRYAYNYGRNEYNIKKLNNNAKQSAKQYDYQKIGKLIKELLNA